MCDILEVSTHEQKPITNSMENASAEKVYLYVYDLSQGMARILSRQMAGIQLDGIWHTSVVVYGIEWYYGQGILTAVPGTTHHGAPLEKVHLGETFVPKEIFLEYIDSLRPVWTADRYHLLDNNCNSFTNELSQFLVGNPIPSYIRDLPSTFLNTSIPTRVLHKISSPLGNSLRPFFENIFGPSRHARPELPQGLPGIPSTFNPEAVTIASSTASNALSTSTIVHVTSYEHLQTIIAGNRCIAVDFTSQSCPPCRMISPKFEEFVSDTNSALVKNKKYPCVFSKATEKKEVRGISVDIGLAADIARRYQVSATPTFMFFLDGKKINEFKGANINELRSSIDFLIYSAFPAHKHTLIDVDLVFSYKNPMLYKTSTNVEQIYNKLITLLKENSVEKLVLLKIMAKDHSFHPSFPAVIENAFNALSIEDTFPLLDLVRLIFNDEKARQHLVKESGILFDLIVPKIIEFAKNNNDTSKAVFIMTLRLVSNMFQDNTSIQYMMSIDQQGQSCNRTLLTALAIECLLHAEKDVRQASIGLVYNMAISVHMAYDDGQREDENLFEEWSSEILAALTVALKNENDVSLVLKILVTLGYFIYEAPESLLQLLQTLGMKTILESKNLYLKNLKTDDESSQKDVKSTLKFIDLCLKLIE